MIKINLHLQVHDTYVDGDAIGNLVASLIETTKSGHGLTVELPDGRKFDAHIVKGHSVVVFNEVKS